MSWDMNANFGGANQQSGGTDPLSDVQGHLRSVAATAPPKVTGPISAAANMIQALMSGQQGYAAANPGMAGNNFTTPPRPDPAALQAQAVQALAAPPPQSTQTLDGGYGQNTPTTMPVTPGVPYSQFSQFGMPVPTQSPSWANSLFPSATSNISNTLATQPPVRGNI